jgi:ammonium transporter, Amt family
MVNSGDTAWLLASAALVFFMMPGLALFYGGLVGAKNIVATMVQSFIAIGLVSVLWVAIGYSLTFGSDHAGLIGGLDHVFLNGVGGAPTPYAPTVPATAFMVFQMKFAVITPALIAGAFAERMRFSAYLLFVGLWSILVYAPLGHWVWGGGFLGGSGLGAIDFAGGSVVHASAGAAALAAALYIGRRRQSAPPKPNNVPLVLLGAGILWFGWFGFNAGSAGAASDVAASAFVNTQLGASMAMLVWMALEWSFRGKPTGEGIATGAVAGLAAITPASGFVPAWGALIIGAAAGLICFGAVQLKSAFKYDDTLDVVGVHMVGGVTGVVLTGALTSLAINAAGAAAGWLQLGRQSLLAVIAMAFPFVATLALLWLINRFLPVRVSAEEEATGLDLSQHGESGYHHVEELVLDIQAVHDAEVAAAPGNGNGSAAHLPLRR